MSHQLYQSDLSDRTWKQLTSLIPAAKTVGMWRINHPV